MTLDRSNHQIENEVYALAANFDKGREGMPRDQYDIPIVRALR